MTDFIAADALTALLQVVLIDLVLAGDNAVVIGLAAAGLPDEQRRRAIVVGILAATALRIAFAGVAIGRADGHCCRFPRPSAPEASLDRLCRTGDHPLCRLRDDLSRCLRAGAGDRWSVKRP